MTTKQIYEIGDCLELLRKQKSNFFKLAITSPPYNIGKDYGVYKDNVPWDEFIEWNMKILSELLRVSSQVVYIIGTHNNMEFFRKLSPKIEASGWYYKTMYCPKYLYVNPLELAIFISREKPSFNKIHKPPILMNGQLTYWIPVVFGSIERLFEGHPCTFPDRISNFFINSLTEENDYVIDPFVGSGTTLCSCKTLNRNCIGFELNPEYGKIIEKRLQNTLQKDNGMFDF